MPAASIVWTAYRLRALTVSGAWAALLTGCAMFAFGSLWLSAALLLFFVGGSATGRLGTPQAVQARSRAAKGSCRDAGQVAANGGVAVLCGAVAALQAYHLSGASLRWTAAALGALAAACGDTLSTELGAALGRNPRDVLTLRPVVAGTSGGVTLAGLLAACGGGALVGLAGILAPGNASAAHWVLSGACAGLGGSLADSLLGASLQARWRCSICGEFIETPHHDACQAAAAPQSGLTWLTNDGVNAAATAAGAAIGFLLFRT